VKLEGFAPANPDNATRPMKSVRLRWIGLLAILATCLLASADSGSASRRTACTPLTVSLPHKPGSVLLLRNDALWVTTQNAGVRSRSRLLRLDSRSGRVRASFPLPLKPYRLVAAFGSLWLTGENTRATRRYGGAVLRIDPRTGRVTSVITGERRFGAALAATTNAVWVGGGDIVPVGKYTDLVRWVFEIDPHKNEVVRIVKLRPTTVIDLLADGPYVWATGWGGVVKLSRKGRVLFRQRFDGSGWALARSPGAVWVAQPFFGNRNPRTQRQARRLLRVATIKPRRVDVVELRSPPVAVFAAAGTVWLGTADGRLMRASASEVPPMLTNVPIDFVPTALAPFPGGAWIAERDRALLRRICSS
jgi:hypothetical protein